MNIKESVADQLLRSLPKQDAVTARQSLLPGVARKINSRRITEKTCSLYDYHAGAYRSDVAQIANYRDCDGLTVAQHVRYGEKKFAWVGREKGIKLQLFGQHLGGQGTLILTEGELDAMSVYECLKEHRHRHGKFVAASVPDGAQSAKRSCVEQLGWILRFDRVVIFMDNDEPGRRAAADLAEVIGPSAAIASGFAYKDANEAWVKGDYQAILDAVSTAQPRRPEAVVHAPDLLERVLKPEHRQGLPYPWDGWTRMTEGMKPGQLVMVSGGTGIGKSLFTRSIALHLCKQEHKVAYVGLEESCETTIERMLSEELKFNPAFHLDTPEERARRDPNMIREAMDRFAPNLFLLDEFGGGDFDAFVATVKHYVLAEGCKVVVLDHFSLLADGISLATDQRRAIDRCIKQLKELCVSLNFVMIVVCHLSRVPGGMAHEEGGEPTLAELRGSHSLAQIPDIVVMLSRNPRASCKVDANTTLCWLKKNRVKGELGLMAKLHFLDSCVFHEVL